MEDKKYYCIKLKKNFFDLPTIDWIMSQNNGCEYIVLYQMLCLKTANTDGKLVSQIGEMLIPYDIEKIARDTKYFSNDTIRVALELFKSLGLIYVSDDNTMTISNYDEMVGCESQWAEKKRLYRQKQKQIEGQQQGQIEDNVRQEYRDKRLEIRDKSIEYRDKEKDDYHHPKRNDDDEEKTHTEIFALWEKNIMPLTPIVGEKLQALLGEVGEAAVEQGILAAVEHGARNFAYVQTVARNYVSGNSKKQNAGAGYSSMDLVNELYGDVGGEGDAATAENSPNDC